MVAVFWHNGDWHEAQPKVLGPMDHAMWMSSSVFDGARIFGGLAPDLDRHCQRVVDSAEKMLLAPTKNALEIEALVRAAFAKLPADRAYYVRPMFYALNGFISPEPESTEFILAVYESPMPEPKGSRICTSPYRRPPRDSAPTDAKTGGNYPNSARALADARNRGFDNALILDPSGNVAELASANLWLVKEGVARTPVWNGTFLDGITKHRTIKLLREAGVAVEETTLTLADFGAADEIFSTGNYGKVMPVIRFEDHDLQPGPVFQQARALYFAFAESQRLR